MLNTVLFDCKLFLILIHVFIFSVMNPRLNEKKAATSVVYEDYVMDNLDIKLKLQKPTMEEN